MFAIVREPKLLRRQGYVIHISFCEDQDKNKRLSEAVAVWREQWRGEYKKPYLRKVDMFIGLRV